MRVCPLPLTGGGGQGDNMQHTKPTYMYMYRVYRCDVNAMVRSCPLSLSLSADSASSACHQKSCCGRNTWREGRNRFALHEIVPQHGTHTTYTHRITPACVRHHSLFLLSLLPPLSAPETQMRRDLCDAAEGLLPKRVTCAWSVVTGNLSKLLEETI